MNAKSFKIYSLGCKVNQYDANSLRAELFSFGLIEKNDNADIAIINTCSVTKNAIKKDKESVVRARRENPGSKIVVIGCWPQVSPVEAESIGADIVWGVGDHKELVEKITDKEKVGDKIVPSIVKNGYRTRYLIKIQDGCEQYCTYCVIPYARGKIKSRGDGNIVKEVKEAVTAGYKEIVLCGVHLGMYGRERGGNLNDLIKKLLIIRGLFRLRLSSIEINEVNDELIGMMKKSDVFCRHLHLPLQSGCDKILKAMRRPYDTSYYRERIKDIRKQMSEIAISADVIVGFPGETKKDFTDTCNFVNEMAFSRLHVFPFSAHSKAPASTFPNQVDDNTRLLRARKLRAMGYRLTKKYKDSFVGRKLPIIVEKADNSIITGKTEYYFDRSAVIRDKYCRRGNIVSI